tara:strand:- start:472 stop:711 length:240 start_codon:yes stop_codon:yes gene_type:complete
VKKTELRKLIKEEISKVLSEDIDVKAVYSSTDKILNGYNVLREKIKREYGLNSEESNRMGEIANRALNELNYFLGTLKK